MAGGKDLSKKSSSELSTPNTPKRGMTPIEQEDRMVPRLKLIQALSPEVTEGIAKDGDLVNSITKENYGTSLDFVPILASKSRILWLPREDGGGIACSAPDGKLGSVNGECMLCNRKAWQGKTPPECTGVLNFISLILKKGDERPDLACVGFIKTSYVAGKSLLNILSYKNVDTFTYTYTLSSEKKSNDFGKFNVLHVRDTNNKTAEGIYKIAEAFYATFERERPKVSEINEGETTEEATDAPF